MAILRVVVEVEALGALALEQGELDVVGEEEELVWIGHAVSGARILRGSDSVGFEFSD